MAKDKPTEERSSAAVARNFTISREEKIRALAAGPPPYALRLRRIEDLEVALVRALAELEAESGPIDEGALPVPIAEDLEKLNRLIEDHNRYYPIEKCLPIDVRTRRLMDWGEPWAPMPRVEIETLLARARDTDRAPS
jgi:hypothetical protein